jgi:hypothetical protein
MSRVTRRKAINPEGVIGIKIGDAAVLVSEFKEMKNQRDEAMRILKLRTLPNFEAFHPHTNVDAEVKKSVVEKPSAPKIRKEWANVLKNLK